MDDERDDAGLYVLVGLAIIVVLIAISSWWW
jgi:hypothetical protein